MLSPHDRRVQGHLDVLEDRLLLENTKVNERTQGYDPERDWFSHASWQYQCGLERHANIHLAADDVPNFLRSFLNQYAVDIMPGEYTFREHTTGGPPDKIYEESCFLERFRNMMVMEEEETLWLARATPRAWLEQGRKITVEACPHALRPGELRDRLGCGRRQDHRDHRACRRAVRPRRFPAAAPSQGREAHGESRSMGPPGRTSTAERELIRLHGRERQARGHRTLLSEIDEAHATADPAGSGHSSNLSVSAISSAVRGRISMFRKAPVVSQVAKPSGWLRRVSIRVATRRSW